MRPGFVDKAASISTVTVLNGSEVLAELPSHLLSNQDLSRAPRYATEPVEVRPGQRRPGKGQNEETHQYRRMMGQDLLLKHLELFSVFRSVLRLEVESATGGILVNPYSCIDARKKE